MLLTLLRLTWDKEGEPNFTFLHNSNGISSLRRVILSCLAMEDAFVIANLTKKHGLSGERTSVSKGPTKEQLGQICKEYQEQRGKRVGDTVLRARKRAAITHALEGMQQTEEWYSELAKEDGMHIMEGKCDSSTVIWPFSPKSISS